MRVGLGVVGALVVATVGASEARAESCGSVDDFAADVAGSGGAASAVRVDFTVTGVNPADYPGSKGGLVHLLDTRCAKGAEASLKVYGTADPPNASHPAGTLKFEYGNQCCAAPACQAEGWADPGTSGVVFADGTETCAVEARLDPKQIAYHLDCGNGAVFDAVGDNVDQVEATTLAILKRVDGGWAMPNAKASNVSVCWTLAPSAPGAEVAKIPVKMDAYVSASQPDTVAPVDDLVSEAGDSQILLAFDASAVPGKPTKVTLFLHLSDVASADGDGGDAYALADTPWSEATVTWSTKPATVGASLARVSPAHDFAWYGWDVTAALAAPRTIGLAIVPEAADQNGAHFFSKEASSENAPYLRVEYVVRDEDGDGVPDGPDCDDHDASVKPGAVESCNGKDDDCDGQVDEGCAGAGGAGAGGEAGSGGGAASGAGGAGDAQGNPSGRGVSDDASPSDGSGCALGSRGVGGAGAIAIGLAALGLAARRRRPA
jgi:hypothetical protein